MMIQTVQKQQRKKQEKRQDGRKEIAYEIK